MHPAVHCRPLLPTAVHCCQSHTRLAPSLPSALPLVLKPPSPRAQAPPPPARPPRALEAALLSAWGYAGSPRPLPFLLRACVRMPRPCLISQFPDSLGRAPLCSCGKHWMYIDTSAVPYFLVLLVALLVALWRLADQNCFSHSFSRIDVPPLLRRCTCGGCTHGSAHGTPLEGCREGCPQPVAWPSSRARPCCGGCWACASMRHAAALTPDRPVLELDQLPAMWSQGGRR